MTLFAAKKATKDIGWDVYKKIGCSTEIQKMYIKVQWFSLMLKINIYFEFTSYALYFIMLASFSANWEQGSPTIPVLGVSLAVLVLILPSLVMSRYAISRESNLLMTSFIVFQFVFIGSTVYVMYHKKEFLTDWYAFAGYCLCTLVAAIVTIILSIVCQLNFNKGLKDFVRWKLFSKTVPRRQSAAYMSQASTFYGLEGQRVDMPIDD
ncbi:hypothetical protein INT47_008774 [Mucor saturninus]|uniref:Uncharacterized protein n=1 Tax=Mucor saturninus TaxID=64648 RepID=A0A8H7RK17_9FUNG|nr:hypothetical protein INT47_008774 [Mucor saturninus]